MFIRCLDLNTKNTSCSNFSILKASWPNENWKYNFSGSPKFTDFSSKSHFRSPKITVPENHKKCSPKITDFETFVENKTNLKWALWFSGNKVFPENHVLRKSRNVPRKSRSPKITKCSPKITNCSSKITDCSSKITVPRNSRL